MESQITYIDMIRHGEPQGGTRFRGHLDHPLSDLGWRQMQQALSRQTADAPAATVKPWDLICTSPLKRCSEFAQTLAQESSTPLQVIDGFKEISFGDWQGKTYADVEEVTPGVVNKFFLDPVGNPVPNSENIFEFRDRVHKGFKSVVENNLGKKVLLVGHGAVIRSILNLALDIPMNNIFRIDVPFASLTRVKVEKSIDGLRYSLISHAS